MKLPAWLLWSAATLAVSAACPGLEGRAAEVILVRHGDKDIQRGDFNLSPTGFLRAIALGRLIPARTPAATRRRFPSAWPPA